MKPSAEKLYDVLSDVPSALGEMGMYYLEGGCFGFAAALHGWLETKEVPSQILLSTDFVHAWVLAGDQAFDAQGPQFGEYWTVGERHSLESLRVRAVDFGCTNDEFDADRDAALAVLEALGPQMDEAMPLPPISQFPGGEQIENSGPKPVIT